MGKELAAIAKKYADAASDEIQQLKADTVDAALLDTATNDAGSVYDVAITPSFVLTIHTRRAGKTLDKTALLVKLQTKHGLTASQAEDLINECSKETAIPKWFVSEPQD